MALTKERTGEIAMLFISYRVRTGGLKLDDVKREMGNMAKEIGITTEEAMEFIEPIFRDELDKAFKKDASGSIGYKQSAAGNQSI
jgi:hypothetical protein